MPKFLTPLLISLCSVAVAAAARWTVRTMRDLAGELGRTRTEIAKLPAHAATVAEHTIRLDGMDVRIEQLTDDVAVLRRGYEQLRDHLVRDLIPPPSERSPSDA